MVQDLKAGVRVTSNVSTIIQEIIPTDRLDLIKLVEFN